MKHLSPRRLALAAATIAATAVIAPTANAATFSGPASQRVIDTGITVIPGDLITGSVSADLDVCGGTNPNCHIGEVEPSIEANPNYFISGAKGGGEFYRIGDGPWTPFSASDDDKSVSRPVTADRAGALSITTNDFPDYYGDNRGTLSVTTGGYASGKGVSAVGTTFDFLVTPKGGYARLDMNPDRRYGLREGNVTCFNQVGNRAVFGIFDTAGSKPVYREFAIQDGGLTGTDRLQAIGSAHSVAPPPTCSNRVPRTVRNVIRSGDITIGLPIGAPSE